MNVGRYGDTKPAGSNIQLAHTVNGSPAVAVAATGGTAPNDVVQPAGIHSTAPFKTSDKRCRYEVGANRTCKGWRARGSDYCPGHMRKLGLLQHPQDANKKAK